PLACCAPPRRKEWNVSATVTASTAAMQSGSRFTYVPTGWSRISSSGTSGESVIAAWSYMSGSIGQVSNSVLGNSDSPCSSDVKKEKAGQTSTPDHNSGPAAIVRNLRQVFSPNAPENSNMRLVVTDTYMGGMDVHDQLCLLS
ncbi:Hypothetical protein PHPALM_11584, partial [Phytophthora palmivora]